MSDHDDSTESEPELPATTEEEFPEVVAHSEEGAPWCVFDSPACGTRSKEN